MPADREDVLCVLLAARTLIDCEGWTQNAFARDAAGESCEYDRATCFCALGALRAVGSGVEEARLDAVVRVQHALGNPDGVMHFNDYPTTTKADVLHVFDLAIAAEEARLG